MKVSEKVKFLSEIKKLHKNSYITATNKIVAHLGSFDKVEVLSHRDRKTLFSDSYFNNPDEIFLLWIDP